jgi:HAD superfamily hydrolase (TIGR01509 family)
VIWDATRRGWEEAQAGRDNLYLPTLIGVAAAHFGVTLNDETRLQAARVYASGVEQDLVPFEGARELLRQLKARGLPLGLLSNTTWPGQFHRQELERFELVEFFDEMVFSCDVGLWKPNAPAFRYVTGRLGLDPSEAVFVGDIPHIDVLGAQQAGLRAVWISANGRTPGDVKPDAVIHRLAELPAALDQWE